ncbi:MAG TPA: ABC transporter permease [Firmicutes bacterium]|nr:ABC transporter permease [Bacillota bacterium]
MIRYIMRRLLHLIPTLLAVATIVFLLIHFIPGDPVQTMLGLEATPEDVAALREVLGLNDPILVQYKNFLANLIKFDFGSSIYYKENVFELFKERFPATVELAVTALLFGTLVAIPLGILSATHRHSVIDVFSTIFSLIGISTPVFWLGILLMYIFSLQLGWLPLTGRGGPIWTLQGIKHILLPAISLGATMMASTTRLVRSSMLEVLSQDYVRTAHAKGLTNRVVLYKHALKNAMLPVLTNVGLQMGVLLGGSFLTETVFAWPGVGRFAVQAVLRRDFAVIQGVTFMVAFLLIMVNLCVDILYTFIDPRIKYN